LNHCSDVEKTPTQLFYGEQDEPTKWGYSIPSDKKALRWFKLLLLDDGDIPAHVSDASQLREAREVRTKLNKDPIEIIGCFLRNLWNHTIDTIKRSISAELLQECQFHVIITMPAIWPFYAQQRMKKAAQLSGILEERSCGQTTLRFISEPEAAALATMKDLSKRSTTHVS
jgi:molecular chaperone DnaK (HSP70)